MFKNILKKFNIIHSRKAFENEDSAVLKFIENLDKNKEILYLEAGSGVGRFPEVIKGKMPNLSIKCLEINRDLVEMAKEKGLDAIQGNIVDMPFGNEDFDLVHCSHVIEHLKYPDIIHALDEVFRVTKTGGYVIIRSPLMHRGFYFDIDHVRPYPPESIFNYYNNLQQQEKGKNKIEKVKVWYRRESLSINIHPKVLSKMINLILRILWVYIKFPISSKNGYILILRKTS